MEMPIDLMSQLTFKPSLAPVAGPSVQLLLYSIHMITQDNNRYTQIDTLDDFGNGPIIHPEILSVMEPRTKTPGAMDAKLQSSFSRLNN
jgi:hypothetical protein